MTHDLITRDALEITFTREAVAMRTQAMMLAVEIESVTDADSQAVAVQAQTALNDFLKLIEKNRVEIKQPILDAGRKVDSAAKDFCEKVKAELTRVSALIGNFQALELAKQRAAEAARNEELTRLEREKQAELAKANSFEARDAVHERFQQQVESIPRTPVAARVEGQRVQEEWEFDVTDKFLLAKMHPNLVNIEPRRAEIKEELKLGHRVYGIDARKVVVAGVRAPKVKEIWFKSESAKVGAII